MPDTTRTVRLGALRLDEPEGGLDDGALVSVRGARPVVVKSGGDASIEYEVVGTPAPVFAGLSGVLWAALHVRQQPAVAQSTVPTRDARAATLSRLVVVRRAGADVVLEAYPWSERDAGVLGAPVLTAALPALAAGDRLTGSLLPAGPLAVVVLSTQAEPGAVPVPYETLVAHDDAAVPLGRSPQPTATLTSDPTAGPTERGFRPGYVCVRVAYRTAWGHLPPGPPRLHQVSVPVVGGTPDRQAPHTLSFTVEPDAAVPLASGPWARVVTGWSAFVSVATYSDDVVGLDREAALGGPYRLVASAAVSQATVPSVLQPAGGLDTAEPLDDGDLSYARILAATGLAFNGRAVLGAAALDFPLPRIVPSVTGTHRVRVGVEIETTSGVLLRIGPPQPSNDVAVFGEDGDVVGYPDRRARRMVVYHAGGPGPGAPWLRAPDAPAVYAPPPPNLAALRATWASVPPDPGGPALTDAEVDALNAELDYDPNRLLASEVSNVYRWPARRSLHVGDGPDDAVVALATTADPASAGQFGQFPLLALTRRDPQLVQLGDGSSGADVFFVGARPAGDSGGCSSQAACANVPGAVVAASLADVRAFTPSAEPDPVSAALGDDLGPYAGHLAAGAALGSLRTARGREVWVCSADADRPGVVCRTADGLWYERDLDRVAFVQIGGVPGAPHELAGIDRDGRLWLEDGDRGEVAVVIETAPLALGAPGERKRLRRGRVHQRPALLSLVVGVTEHVLARVPGGPSGAGAEEPVLSDAFASAYDGAPFRFFSGSVVQPRLVLVGSGHRGQRLTHLVLTFDVRASSVLGSGTRQTP